MSVGEPVGEPAADSSSDSTGGSGSDSMGSDTVGASGDAAAVETQSDTQTASLDPALVTKGKKVFRKCMACHTAEPDKHRVGPSLHGVFGRTAGTADGYARYSAGMKDKGVVWNETTLDAFLSNPRGYVDGTNMAFPGLKKEDDRAAVIEYLHSLSAGGES